MPGVATLCVDRQPDPDIQIAGYRIEARLGRGGMGEVYRAVQLSLDRRVALKVLPPKLAADDVFRRRFLRESRIAASIDHPSIIPIYDLGELPDRKSWATHHSPRDVLLDSSHASTSGTE